MGSRLAACLLSQWTLHCGLAGVLDMDPAFLDVDGEHQHDNRVSSVGFNQPGELDMDKTNSWIAKLLQLEGNNIYRYTSPLLTTSLLFNLKKILPTAPYGRV